jgi:hypothetical protein
MLQNGMFPLDLIHSYLMGLELKEDRDQEEWDRLVEAREALLAKGGKANQATLVPKCFQ